MTFSRQPPHSQASAPSSSISSSPVREDDAALPAIRSTAAIHASPARRRTLPPRSPTSCGSLPPEGAGLAWGGPARRPSRRPLATSQSRAASAMFVKVANWLRWRRLPKASPSCVWFTQGSRLAPAPRYWHRPIAALSRPAASQAQAAAVTTRVQKSRLVSRQHSASSPAAQAQENISGTAAGDGPGAKGLSQGRAISRNAGMKGIAPECAAGAARGTTGSMLGIIGHGENAAMTSQILITGGAGYIGSHTAVALMEAGHRVVLVDNLCNSSARVLDRLRRLCGDAFEFVQADVRDGAALDALFAHHPVVSVIHFAGLKAVGESVAQPLRYLENNVGGTISLLQAMERANLRRLVFSSSATVYGDPQSVP